MQIVINISEEDYHKVKDGRASVSMMRNAIRNGTPLPKGHGDLKDVNEIKALGNYRNMTCTFEDIDDATIVLEADKEDISCQ